VSPSTSFKMSAAKKSDGYGWMLPVTRGLIAASIAFGLILQIKIFFTNIVFKFLLKANFCAGLEENFDFLLKLVDCGFTTLHE